jgi:hypothetical protein
VITTVLTNLEIILEFAFEEVRLAAVAFDEDVFRLDDAFLGRNGFDAFIFLIEPSHKNGGKVSTPRGNP